MVRHMMLDGVHFRRGVLTLDGAEQMADAYQRRAQQPTQQRRRKKRSGTSTAAKVGFGLLGALIGIELTD